MRQQKKTVIFQAEFNNLKHIQKCIFKNTDFKSEIQKLGREMNRNRKEKMRIAQTQGKNIEKK